MVLLMILQRVPRGLMVVRQPEHGHQTGLFAQAWGNEEVPPVADRAGSARLAAGHHDDGWATWELYPTLDPATGQPAQFVSLTPVEHVPLYRAGIERAAAVDPFAGILVSMHGAGLYNGRYGTFSLVERDLSDQERSLVDEFLRDMADMQQSIAHSLNLGSAGHVSAEPEVRSAYLRLQAWDRLSLQYLYFGAADGVIAPLPLDARTSTQLSCRGIGPAHLALDPYPFADSGATFPVEYSVVPDREYQTPADFIEAWRDAPVEILECKASPR
jgi:hypothetical protein